MASVTGVLAQKMHRFHGVYRHGSQMKSPWCLSRNKGELKIIDDPEVEERVLVRLEVGEIG